MFRATGVFSEMSQAFLLVKSLLFITIMYSWMLVLGIIAAPAAAVSRDATYWFVKLYCRQILWLLRFLCGIDFEVRGGIPTGDVAVVSKHQSFLDVILHVVSLDRPQFIMKRELSWIPVFGFYAMRIGCTPIHRENRARATDQMSKGVEKEAGADAQLVIYPQGTRVSPGDKKPYKAGAFILYHRHEKPCVLAATNVGHFWPRLSLLRRPGLAVVEYLSVVPPGLFRDEFMVRIEREIEQASDRLSEETLSHSAKQ